MRRLFNLYRKKELSITNQNPRSKGRRKAPPLTSWVLYPK